jgi:hypothetical protein
MKNLLPSASSADEVVEIKTGSGLDDGVKPGTQNHHHHYSHDYYLRSLISTALSDYDPDLLADAYDVIINNENKFNNAGSKKHAKFAWFSSLGANVDGFYPGESLVLFCEACHHLINTDGDVIINPVTIMKQKEKKKQQKAISASKDSDHHQHRSSSAHKKKNSHGDRDGDDSKGGTSLKTKLFLTNGALSAVAKAIEIYRKTFKVGNSSASSGDGGSDDGVVITDEGSWQIRMMLVEAEHEYRRAKWRRRGK